MSDKGKRSKDPVDTFSSLVEGLARRVGGISATARELASRTTEFTLGTINRTPEQMELMGRAGKSLKDMRDVAGLTISEVSQALNLKDEGQLEKIESGKSGLSIESILRLASLYARNDPLPFIMQYTRVYAPGAWDFLGRIGLDKFPLQYERERLFINIYRREDAARKLSDEGFAKVLEFTRNAFLMSLHFVEQQELELKQAAEKNKSSATGESDTGDRAGNTARTREPAKKARQAKREARAQTAGDSARKAGRRTTLAKPAKAKGASGRPARRDDTDSTSSDTDNDLI